MPIKNDDKLVKDLNQIKQKQEDVLARIDELKQDSDADLLPELESIEQTAWRAVIEIGELQKKINLDLTAQIERNSILARMIQDTGKKPEMCGRIRIS